MEIGKTFKSELPYPPETQLLNTYCPFLNETVQSLGDHGKNQSLLQEK